jgi:DNA-binding CsgD family transcriptional regulator
MPKTQSDPPLERLIRQTTMTNVLLAAGLRQHMSQTDIVALLKGTGASLQEIAEVLGTSYATIAVTSQRLRKRAKGATDVEEEAVARGDVAAADLREAGDGPERS